jgi:hypothetical protein
VSIEEAAKYPNLPSNPAAKATPEELLNTESVARLNPTMAAFETDSNEAKPKMAGRRGDLGFFIGLYLSWLVGLMG